MFIEKVLKEDDTTPNRFPPESIPKLIEAIDNKYLLNNIVRQHPEMVHHIKNDTLALNYITESCENFPEVFDEIKDNPNLKWRAICSSPKTFLNKATEGEAISYLIQCPGDFKHASDAHKNNKKIALAVLAKKGDELSHVSEDLRNDPEIINTAKNQGKYLLAYARAGEQLNLKDPYIDTIVNELKIIGRRSESAEKNLERFFYTFPQQLKHAPESIKDNFIAVEAAYKADPTSLQYASEQRQQDIRNGKFTSPYKDCTTKLV